jgi:hypothetical protein
MSGDGERDRSDQSRARELREWVELQRKVLPLDTALDQVRSRLQAVNDEDKATLEPELFALLIEAHRDDEARQLLDAAIAKRPNEVLSPTDGWAYERHDDPDERLKLIDFVLERARHTGTWVRSNLGSKAWILAYLGRGEELGELLEQIMAHKVRRDVPDVGRERYFVDVSPPGLIAADTRARYDRFCPKRAGDVPFPPPEFEPPEWGPDGEEIIVTRPRADAIDRDREDDSGRPVPWIATTVSAGEIDQIILPRLAIHGTWRKTAAVIGWVAQQCEERQLTIADHEIFERILQLVIDGLLESQGNLSLWRYSEVRLVRSD